MLQDRDWRKLQAHQDIQHALSALTFFAEVPAATTAVERRRFRCYHDSAVISYCRPFTTSKGPNGLPKLSFKGVGVIPTAEETHLHERLIVYRNKVVAHTDADRMRLLFTTFAVEGIAVPHIVEDEGFEFLDDILELEKWFRKPRHALGEFIFHKAQEFPHGTRLLRDYLNPDGSKDPRQI